MMERGKEPLGELVKNKKPKRRDRSQDEVNRQMQLHDGGVSGGGGD
jgi:hypothetical protein